MAEYPKRPPFFAAKVCKLLGRTCAAQTITPAGAYLITQIAYVEDAKRYSGPVTYFREPLMHITGIGTAARLIRVRNLCVEAGWLHYEEPPKGSRQPGVYWVTIPEKFKDLPLSPYDDEPVAQSNANEYANRTQTDTRIERKPIHESNANQHTFIPIPNPSPNPSPNVPASGDAGSDKPAREPYTSQFGKFWEAFPRKADKRKAFEAYQRAVKRIEGRFGNRLDAHEHIQAAAAEFAKSDLGQSKFCKYAEGWLNADKFDDDRETWVREDNRGSPQQPRRGVNTRNL